MERKEYEEFLEFKEFIRLRQQRNSQDVGKTASSETVNRQYKAPDDGYGKDTLDYMTDYPVYFDNQGYREG